MIDDKNEAPFDPVIQDFMESVCDLSDAEFDYFLRKMYPEWRDNE